MSYLEHSPSSELPASLDSQDNLYGVSTGFTKTKKAAPLLGPPERGKGGKTSGKAMYEVPQKGGTLRLEKSRFHEEG
jgi:hypothetical protein